MASRMCGQLSLLTVATYLVQAVRAAGKCDAVFKGFSDCLLKLGDSMANYPQGLDDKTNIKTVCTCKSLLFLQEFRRQARELLVFVPVTHRPAQDFPDGTWIRIHLPSRGHQFDSWSEKIPHAWEQRSPRATTTEPEHWSLGATAAEARGPGAGASQPEKPSQRGAFTATAVKSSSHSPQLEKAPATATKTQCNQQ
ncbi:hypothetical protein JEQ12_010817 [Ovis aries]|uniref:Neuritin-like protein n=1 Tax=Ovis aries TaxID=9940 RepID=A0A836CTW6_SHEEP|nr:hypothetical protein JEQ12_010817 [Ovis aries]